VPTTKVTPHTQTLPPLLVFKHGRTILYKYHTIVEANFLNFIEF